MQSYVQQTIRRELVEQSVELNVTENWHDKGQLGQRTKTKKKGRRGPSRAFLRKPKKGARTKKKTK